MPTVSVERVPVQLFGLGRLGFDHLQIVFRSQGEADDDQDGWFVIEGVREQHGAEARLAVEGWQGGTTLSEANGGLAGEDLEVKIGTRLSRGAHDIADGSEAMSLWATLVAFAADIEAQVFPYIPISLPSSPLPTINSSSLVASLMHHAGLRVADTLPSGLRLSPGLGTLLGTSESDTLESSHGFATLVGGSGDDRLLGRAEADTVTKLYGGPGNDTLRVSRGVNVLHGGQPGLAYADDGHDAVDYSGAGEIRIDALPPGVPHLGPDFIVTREGGRDYLFSIEEILWDAARDRITLGNGVGLAVPAEPVPRQSSLRRLLTSEIASDPSLSALSTFGDPLLDPLLAQDPFGSASLLPFDLMAGS